MYSNRDAQPLPVGEPIDVEFDLEPVVWQVPVAHRLRLTIACADADNFDRTGMESPVLRVQLGTAGSWVKVPILAEPEASAVLDPVPGSGPG